MNDCWLLIVIGQPKDLHGVYGTPISLHENFPYKQIQEISGSYVNASTHNAVAGEWIHALPFNDDHRECVVVKLGRKRP